MEGGNVIALTGPDGAVSLEPAGQLELSGAPREHLHQTCAEAGRHLDQVKAVGEKLGLGFLGLGMWPDKTRAELPVMPKGRYAIMLNYMPKVGTLGLDMMLRTCTIQVNLDYASEADMAQKFRVGLALQPLATALVRQFAVHRRQAQRLPLLPQPHLVGHRSATAPACCPSCSRTASATSAISTTRSMCRCTSSSATAAISTPPASPSATSSTAGCPAFPARSRCVSDWTDHLSTAFPEVRLKSFLEMRGADGGPLEPDLRAARASGSACSTTRARSTPPGTRSRTGRLDERQRLRDAVPKLGLDARDARAARRCASSASASSPSPRPGSTRAPGSTASGDNESGFLDPLREVVASGTTPAERLLERYHGDWQGDISRIYEEESF